MRRDEYGGAEEIWLKKSAAKGSLQLKPAAPVSAPAVAPALAQGAWPTLNDPTRFINREISWLAFNTRVMEESENPQHPLMERVRFLSISANNLDEFYMVRVAGLHEQVKAGVVTLSQDGLTPTEQLARVHDSAGSLMIKQQARWRMLRDELRANGVIVLDPEELSQDETEWLRPLSWQRVFPLLTPLAVDPAHPFPFIPNLGIAIALKLRRREDGRLLNALVPTPSQVARFIEVGVRATGRAGRTSGVSSRSKTSSCCSSMSFFRGYEADAKGAFRVVRDSDIEIEEEAEDLVREYTTRAEAAPARRYRPHQDRSDDAARFAQLHHQRNRSQSARCVPRRRHVGPRRYFRADPR